MRHTVFILLLFQCLLFVTRAQDTLSFNTAEEGFDLMRRLASQQNYPQAKIIARQLLASDPDNTDVSVYLARIHAWVSDFDSATVMVNSILKGNPEHPDALTLRVDIDYWRNDWDHLLISAEEALAILPEDTGIRSKYAMALFHTGQIERAREETERILEMNPDDKLARDLQNRMVIGETNNEVFGRYSFDHFNRPYSRRWHMLTVGGIFPYSTGKLIPSINAGHNVEAGSFTESSDIQLNLETYWLFSKRNYLLAGYGISPGNYFPKHRAILDVWQVLPRGFSLSAGLRYFYWDEHFWFPHLALEKYAGNYWLALNNYIFFKEYGVSASFYLTVRRYMEHQYNYLSATIGYGTAPDESIIVKTDLDRLNALSFRIDGSRMAGKRVRLTVSTGYSYEEYLNDTYRHRWSFIFGLHRIL